MRKAVTAGKTAEKIESGEKRPSGSMAKGGKGVAAQCVTLVSARYAHLSADPLRAANDAVGARIAAAMSRKPGAAASAEVVALPSRTGDETH